MLHWLAGLWQKIARWIGGLIHGWINDDKRPAQTYHRSNLHGRHR
jgi:hypothetical protein